ncbi:ABC transporter permease [Vibrio japonicus]|uniref:ABC transporter permease n=1 Tax=Vibrio japonicus TaxID=1824638 RepID=A0ABY5LSD5_9VIBR|nr:FtsX-like permease family protein [Vibrio japonicus]UUM32675.1 ABC transporter permease [Vibrio japonicus]
MLVKLAWRNLWRNKLRTSIILGAVVFGLLGVTAMMGFMTGFVDSMLSNAIRWQTSHIQLHNPKYVSNPDIVEEIPNGEHLAELLRTLPNVQTVSARFIAVGMVASARSNRGVRINGINIDDEARLTPLSTKISDGEFLDREGRNPILVSQKLAERLRLKVGSKVVLTFTDAAGQVVGAAYRVKGIFSTPSTQFDEGNVFVRKSDLQKTASMQGVHEIAILFNDGSDLIQAKQDIHQVTDKVANSAPVLVRDWKQIQPMLATMMNTMHVSNRIILVIFVVAMMFGIINIMLMSVFERTQEFGVLMAVGMQKHKVFTLIMLETTMLGATGALLGLAASATLIAVLHHYGMSLASMSDGLGAYGIDTVLYPRVSYREYQITFLTVFVASVLAAIYPARQILKQRPVDAMAEKK